MNIHDEVDHILAGIEMLQPRPHRNTLEQRLRAFLADVIGPDWRDAPIIAQSMPDGTILYSASKMCLNCGAIHTFLIWPDGDGFQMAEPSPVSDREGDGDGVC